MGGELGIRVIDLVPEQSKLVRGEWELDPELDRLLPKKVESDHAKSLGALETKVPATQNGSPRQAALSNCALDSINNSRAIVYFSIESACS
jgi:hypothetical protein